MFPVGIGLEEVKSVVEAHNAALDCEAFIIAERGEYTIFNYLISFDGTFPEYTGDPVRDREIGILRECRGLTFHTASGVLAARKFHKFFVVNQRAETQSHVIDWTQPHIIMEKLDGSMIAPVGHGKSREWHTKMGATDVAKPVEEFVAANPVYNELADMCCIAGKTPLFEWCSRQQRIVIDYPVDRLVLLAIRDNHTGEYATIEQMGEIASLYGIPTVGIAKTCVFDVDQFMAHTRALKGQEGYVIKFDSGLMVKMKAEEYCLQHNAKEALELEKNVWALILSDVLDDQMALMTPDDRANVSAFVEVFEKEVIRTSKEIRVMHDLLLIGLTTDDERERKKQFALKVEQASLAHHSHKGLLFATFNGRDTAAEIRKVLAKSCGSATSVEDARPLVGGVRWADYRYGVAGA